MKKTMIMLLLLGALTACNNDDKSPDKPKEPVKIDPNALLYIAPTSTKADEPYTAEYIIKNTAFVNKHVVSSGVRGQVSLGLEEEDYLSTRDLVNLKFIFSGSDVVQSDGTPGYFFNWEDLTFTVAVYEGKRLHPLEVTMPMKYVTEDTIAYIPNAVARKCKIDVLAALEAGDIEECYRIFNEDYVFKPIENGAAWRKLKAEGIE